MVRKSHGLCVIGALVTSVDFGAAQPSFQRELDTSFTFDNKNDHAEFSRRVDSARSFSLPFPGILLDSCSFLSVDADGSRDNSSAQGSIDTIASTTLSTFGTPLTTWISRTSANGSISLPEESEESSGTFDLDFSVTSSLTAATPYSLEEVNGDDEVVQTLMLINRGSIIDREGWEWRLDTDRTMTDEDSESDVNSCLFVGKDSEADGEDAFTVTVELVKAAASGLLEGTDVVLTPNAVESFVTIDNFPYTNDTNRVRLNFIVAAGSFAASGGLSATRTFASGDSDADTFFALRTDAVADGNTIDVTVVAEASDLEAYPDTSIHGDLNARFRGGFEIYKFSVLFDAPGAEEIVYDPSLGVGAAPAQTGAAGLSAAPVLATTGLVGTLMAWFAAAF